MSEISQLSSRRVLLEDGMFHGARLTIQDGYITSIDPLSPNQKPSTENFLVPGFIDLQVNGIDDVDVWTTALHDDVDAWQRLEGLLLDQGVTSWCPTLVTGSSPRYRQTWNFFGNTLRQRGRPVLAPHNFGVHLEGPFLGLAPGAHRTDEIQELKLSSVQELIGVHAGDVAIMTLGSQGTDSVEALAQVCTWLREQSIVVSLGHCRPTRREFETAFSVGAGLVTHVFNAMSGVHHREGGLAAWALTDSRAQVTLIADGIHVAPAIISLIFSAKDQGVALITDAVAWRHTSADHVKIVMVDGAPRLPDGTLAGSVITMPGALKVCVHQAGISIEKAVMAATDTPATILGVADRGVLRAGAVADVVLLTDDLDVNSVYLAGRQVR